MELAFAQHYLNDDIFLPMKKKYLQMTAAAHIQASIKSENLLGKALSDHFHQPFKLEINGSSHKFDSVTNYLAWINSPSQDDFLKSCDFKTITEYFSDKPYLTRPNAKVLWGMAFLAKLEVLNEHRQQALLDNSLPIIFYNLKDNAVAMNKKQIWQTWMAERLIKDFVNVAKTNWDTYRQSPVEYFSFVK